MDSDIKNNIQKSGNDILPSALCPLPSRSRGQSVIEILIAITIFTIGLSSIVFLIFGGQSLSLDSAESNQALRLAREGLESFEASSTYNFNGLVSSSSTTNEFLRQITVTGVTTSTKQVVSRVSWSTDPLRTQVVELTTLVTNWYQTQATGGHTGGTGTTGNWANPSTLGSINLGPGESATDLKVKNGIVYITAVASDPKKSDFFIVDATNGQNPVIDTGLDTGPGLNAIGVAGNYAYVGNNKTSQQLQILDISANATSSVVSSFTLPGISGSGAVGNSIFFYNSKAYVGTKSANGPELHVIDVSNPQSPAELGSYKVGADVNSIVVSGNTAFIATASSTAEVIALDVSNPAAVKWVGSYNASGSYAGLSVYLAGTKLYLGRQSGGNDELRVLDVFNPASIKSLGYATTGYDINGLTVRDALAFLATADPNEEFQVWDISSPASIAKVSSFNFPNIATGIDFENNLVYTAVRSNDALRIVTSQ